MFLHPSGQPKLSEASSMNTKWYSVHNEHTVLHSAFGNAINFAPNITSFSLPPSLFFDGFIHTGMQSYLCFPVWVELSCLEKMTASRINLRMIWSWKKLGRATATMLFTLPTSSTIGMSKHRCLQVCSDFLFECLNSEIRPVWTFQIDWIES